MIGTRIGQYEIIEQIPGGGMAQVYRAMQLSLKRAVVIKVPRPELSESPDQMARFRREAETLARLEHENIVRIYDIEEHDGRYFIIMEYVGGGSLDQLLHRSGRLDPLRTRNIAAGVADALAAAHSQQIIHRDIKPGNILFTTSGKPKLADFGIARMLNATSNTSSLLLGTPHYMSPEQVRGETLTPASDVYALGVVLYEMLTGEVPFDAETPFAVAMKHVQERPRPLEEIAGHAPEVLCRVVDRALAKSVAERYRDGAELRDELLSLDLSGATVGAMGGRSAAPPRADRGTGCPECGAALQPGFLTCPNCGLELRHPCGECGTLYDPLAPACPTCGAAPAPAADTTSPFAQPTTHIAAVPVQQPTRLVGSATPGPPAIEPGGTAAGGERGSGETADRRAPGAPAAGGRRPRPATMLIAAGVVLFSAAGALAMFSGGDAGSGGPGAVAVAGAPSDSEPMRSLVEGNPPGDVAFADAPPTHNSGTEEFAPPSSPVLQPPMEPRREQPSEPAPDPPRRTEPNPPAERPRREAQPRETPRDNPPRETRPTETPREAPKETPRETPPPREPEPAPATPSAPAFNAEAARQEINSIIERQRRATESGDLTVLLRDIAPALHSGVTRDFRNMHRAAGSISSRITNPVISVKSPSQAEVSFHALVRGTRKSDGKELEITNANVTWHLTRTQERWLITRASASQ